MNVTLIVRGITECLSFIFSHHLARVKPCVSFGPSARLSRFVTNWVCSTRSRAPTDRRTAAARRTPAIRLSQVQPVFTAFRGLWVSWCFLRPSAWIRFNRYCKTADDSRTDVLSYTELYAPLQVLNLTTISWVPELAGGDRQGNEHASRDSSR